MVRPKQTAAPTAAQAAAPTTPTVFLGCFKDNTNGTRTLQQMAFTLTENNSNDQCKAKCLAALYSLMGRQSAGQCFCGYDGSHNYASQGNSTACTCDADNQGGGVNCVYRIS